MKKFNLNNYIYIQITDEGQKHLYNTVGKDYIEHCIESNKLIIDNEVWYKLQAHKIISLFEVVVGGKLHYNTNVMFDDDSLEDTISSVRNKKINQILN